MRNQKPQGTPYHECCQRRNVFDVVLALQSTVCLHTFFLFGPLVHPTLAAFIVCGPSSCSLRVAVPTPEEKREGGNVYEKLAQIVLCDVILCVCVCYVTSCFCTEIYNGSLLDKDRE